MFIASYLANETALTNINLLHLSSRKEVQAAMMMADVFPHIDFKREVTIGHLMLDITSKAALNARASSDTLILARTDAVAVEGGKTPLQSATELQARGFQIAIFPGGAARAVAHTLQGFYGSLKQYQTTANWKDKMLDFDGLNGVIETAQLLELGKRYE